MASIYEIEKQIEQILESINRLNASLGIEADPVITEEQTDPVITEEQTDPDA